VNADWDVFRDGFIDAFFAAHPVFAVRSGRHEYDGKLPDWTAAGIQAEVARLHKARDDALAFDAGLSDAQRFERDYLVARIDRDLFWLETMGEPFRNPAFYFDWMLDDLDPSIYLSREYAPFEQRMRGYLGYARSIPRVAGAIRANLRTPLPQSYVERGISGFGGFADFYEKDVPAVFANVQDEALRKDLTDANAAAAKAMRELATWLEDQRATATQDYAIGPEKFLLMVKMTEGVTTPLAELEAIGRADLERNKKALAEACAQFAPGSRSSSAWRSRRRTSRRAVPCRGRAISSRGSSSSSSTSRSSPFRAPRKRSSRRRRPSIARTSRTSTFPGPTRKGCPRCTTSRRRIRPGRRRCSATISPAAPISCSPSVHEVWPGHFLNFLHANRVQSIVGRLFVGYAYAEGWAHYGEEMVWEMGISNGDPEIHIGQLSNALLRDARFFSAIGLHTAGMSVADSEKLFHEEAYQDVGSSKQQAARGTFDPASSTTRWESS
jgi:hypothetical protein